MNSQVLNPEKEVWTLITGASRGIGKDLAREAVKAGQNVILHGRDRGALQSLAEELTARVPKVRAEVLIEDLAQERAAERIFAETQKRGWIVNHLINNAGLGNYGWFHEIDPVRDHHMMMVNVVALTELTRLFGREMVKRRSGKILNVASTAAFQPGPGMATYFAEKAYVVSFSEALWSEWKRYGVGVTVLCPGATRTDFAKSAELEGSRLFTRSLVSSSSGVARRGFSAMMAGKRREIPGSLNKWTVRIIPFLPVSWVIKASELMMGGGAKLKIS